MSQQLEVWQKGKIVKIREGVNIVDCIKIIEDEIGMTLSQKRKELYKNDAKSIEYLRRNPVIACEKLLHIELMDS